jgi:hypothetical protein
MNPESSSPRTPAAPGDRSAARDDDAASAAEARNPSSVNYRIWDYLTAVFLIVTTLLRLIQTTQYELVPDEAYYWDWSRHLSLGYYDQGPMVAYVIRITTALFGTSEFGVRIGAVLASLGTLLCGWWLARRHFSRLAGLLFVVFLGVSPLMEVGSVIITYDPLFVFFWSLTLVFLYQALFSEDAPTQRRAWLCAGLSTGLGFLSKHTMLLIAPCLLLFLATSPRRRFWLARPEPYGAFALALALYAGVLYWNAHHHWWTFQHLLFLTRSTHNPSGRRLGDFLASQALLAGPGVFLGTLAVSARTLKAQLADDRDSASWFFVALGMPVFLFFCLMCFKTKVQGNWAPTAWLSTCILLSGRLAELYGSSTQSTRRLWRIAAATTCASAFLTVVLITPALQDRMGIKIRPEDNPVNSTTGWKFTAARVEQVISEMAQGGHKVFIMGSGYQYCGEMAFYLPGHPPTQDMFLHYRLTMYAAYIEQLKKRMGQDAVFVNETTAEAHDLSELFTEVRWDPPLPVYRPGDHTTPIRTVYIARCRGMRRYVGLSWARGG